jgi:hypothetical protein
MPQVEEKKSAAQVAEDFLKKNPPKKTAPKDQKADTQPAPESSTEKKAAEETSDKTEKSSDTPEITDQALIETPDEKLSTEQKEKKAVLVKDQEAKRLPGAEKRINELVGELKALKNEKDQDKERITNLEAELLSVRQTVEQPKNEEVRNQKLSRLAQERVVKQMEEDKSLPLAERREMGKAELEDWIVSDPLAAQEWLADRAVRRDRERRQDLRKEEVSSQAETIIQRQTASRQKVEAKHPELNYTARETALIASGKTKKEAFETIMAESPKVKV